MLVSDWKGYSGPSVVFWTISAVDEIDQVPATHYGFTDEHLAFSHSTQFRAGPSTRLRAGNYDIKYRLGREAENEEE